MEKEYAMDIDELEKVKEAPEADGLGSAMEPPEEENI